MLVGVYVEESVDGLCAPLFQLQLGNVYDEVFEDFTKIAVFLLGNWIFFRVEVSREELK